MYYYHVQLIVSRSSLLNNRNSEHSPLEAVNVVNYNKVILFCLLNYVVVSTFQLHRLWFL